MFYSYNVIMNKISCLAETQKSTETAHCIEKKLLAHMNQFPLKPGSRLPMEHRTDIASIKFINMIMITTCC